MPTKQETEISNYDKEFEKVTALAPMAVGLREILKDFRFRRLSTASNWILAGAIAFIFSILSDPVRFVESYGQWSTKTAVLLFTLSFFYGVKNIISSQAQSALIESETFKSLVKFNRLRTSYLETEEKKDQDSNKPIEQIAGEGFGKAIIFHLTGTRNFWLQLVTFIVGAGIFLVSFLLKDFGSTS